MLFDFFTQIRLDQLIKSSLIMARFRSKLGLAKSYKQRM